LTVDDLLKAIENTTPEEWQRLREQLRLQEKKLNDLCAAGKHQDISSILPSLEVMPSGDVQDVAEVFMKRWKHYVHHLINNNFQEKEIHHGKAQRFQEICH